MATISKINGPMDPALMAKVPDSTESTQDVAHRPAQVYEKLVEEVLDQPQSHDNDTVAMDSERIEEITAKLQSSIDRISKDPHQVAFHKDSQSDKFVIEIKTADGSVVKQFPPEKVLNLMRKLDDLSGMVIDEMT